MGVFSLFTPSHVLTIERRKNQDTGAPVATNDFMAFSISPSVITGLAPATSVCIKYDPYFLAGGGNQPFCAVPWLLTASQRGVGNISIFRWRGVFPRSHIATSGCTYIANEITSLATFTVPILGVNRTYIATGVTGSANASNNYAAAMIWE
jgi:hypothetical protein